ncbi:helix-turn-helix domain-containing protein [Corynebacterium sp. S7]
MEKVNANIASLRQQQGLSRRELIDIMGDLGFEVGETALRRIESGDREVRLVEAQGFSQAFGVSLDAIATQLLDQNPHESEALQRRTFYKKEFERLRKTLREAKAALNDLDNSVRAAEDFGHEYQSRDELRKQVDQANQLFNRIFDALDEYENRSNGSR